MRGAILGMLLALAFGSARAGGGSIDTFRVDSQVLSVGDSVSRVVELLGDPGYKEPIENRYGAWRGERWQYRVGIHDLTLVIRGGRVVAMEDDMRR